MAESFTKWSQETYRLDEIPDKFEFPLLVQVSEGFYGENQVDTFSAGDVIMFDQCVELQKVAARFAVEVRKTCDSGDDYDILKDEILIPLHYKGLLKVKNEIKTYESVRDLTADMPRYVKILETLSVATDDGEELKFSTGTILELDRVLPKQQKCKTDRLVVNIKGESSQVALPLDKTGKFKTVSDGNEYTLKDAVDRYYLPQVVCFLDNKLHKIYTQDLIERVQQMVTVTTSALQIRRLVKQKVLIGHYRMPDQLGDQSDSSCKRTLVVVPLDSVDLKEIVVQVHTGDIDGSVYETLATVKNRDKRQSMLTEELYVDFVKKPRLIRLEAIQSPEIPRKFPNENDGGGAPALPPRPGRQNTYRRLPLLREVKDEAPPLPPLREVKDQNFRRNVAAPALPARPHIYRNERFTQNKGQKDPEQDDGDYILPCPKKTPTGSPLLPTKEKSKSTKQKASKTKKQPSSPDMQFSIADLDFGNIKDKTYYEKKKFGGFFQRKKKDKDKSKIGVVTPSQMQNNQETVQENLENKSDGQSLVYSCQGGKKLIDGNIDSINGKNVDNTSGEYLVGSGIQTCDDTDADDNHAYNEPDEWLLDTYIPMAHEKKIQKTETSLTLPPREQQYSSGVKHISQEAVESPTLKGEHNSGKRNDGANGWAIKLSETNKTSDADRGNNISENKDQQTKDSRPVAHVSPQNNKPLHDVKEFHLLTVDELHERLIICGMKDFAEFCYEERINGPFLTNMDEETLNSFELSKFQVRKLKQIMSGWISK